MDPDVIRLIGTLLIGFGCGATIPSLYHACAVTLVGIGIWNMIL